jgi:hypothetical protein
MNRIAPHRTSLQILFILLSCQKERAPQRIPLSGVHSECPNRTSLIAPSHTIIERPQSFAGCQSMIKTAPMDHSIYERYSDSERTDAR